MSMKSRRWVKVWHEIMNDTKFHDMTLDQQARWFNLLVYVSCHGQDGTAIIPAPARLLVHQLHCADFEEMRLKMRQLVNVQIVENGNAEISVTFPKWNKYQVDSTVTERVRRHRVKNVTPQEKEKEKEEEKEKEAFFVTSFWPAYPKKVDKSDALKAWLKISRDLYPKIMDSLLIQVKSDNWKKDNGKYIPYGASWLNGKRWEDELTSTKRWDS